MDRQNKSGKVIGKKSEWVFEPYNVYAGVVSDVLCPAVLDLARTHHCVWRNQNARLLTTGEGTEESKHHSFKVKIKLT